MATDKTFSVVGVSNLNGKFKVRYANSLSRRKVLADNGHTDIWLTQLEAPGRKEDCVDALLNYINEPSFSEQARNAVLEEAREFGFIV